MIETDIAIIGSGPAGLTAAIYAVRAGLKAHVIAGYAWGGQLMFTGRVDNYPGFPDGVDGPELMQRMRDQTENQGAVVLDDEVDEFIPDPDATNQHPIHTIKTMNGETIAARAVILATGSEPKWLDIPGEQELRAGGVSSCATCDGAFFRGKNVVIVGGGDTAMEETLHLAKLVNHVTVVHRREHLRATQAMVNRVKEQPNVDFALSRVPVRVEGEKRVSGLTVRKPDGAEETIPTEGVFVAIGHNPVVRLVEEVIPLSEYGTAVRLPDTTQTTVPGLFVAGDVWDHHYRQAVTAAGDGCRAAMDAERWLGAPRLESAERYPGYPADAAMLATAD
jgi:thioredoxin reductase (NADPH)